MSSWNIRKIFGKNRSNFLCLVLESSIPRKITIFFFFFFWKIKEVYWECFSFSFSGLGLEIVPRSSDIENIFFDPFDKMDTLFEDPNDPDSHYFDERDYGTRYFDVNEINTFLNDIIQHEEYSLLHLNIRSLRSNVDDFRTQ